LELTSLFILFTFGTILLDATTAFRFLFRTHLLIPIE
jgi:hypothetical protein